MWKSCLQFTKNISSKRVKSTSKESIGEHPIFPLNQVQGIKIEK